MIERLIRWWTEPGPPEGATIAEQRFYQVTLFGTPFAAAIHVLLMSIFAALQVWELALFHVGSTLAWCGSAVACRAGAQRFGLALGVFEVVSMAVVSSWMLGWEAGFHLYPLSIAVILAVSPDRRFAAGQWVVQLGAWTALFLLIPHEHQPWSPVSRPLTVALNAANHLIAFASVGYVLSQVMSLANSKEGELQTEHARSESLLQNILPTVIADRLKAGERTIADGHREASVLFSDLVGFTRLSAQVSPEELVDLLNQVFRRIDEEVERRGLEKIKTIGDAYMVAAGLPEPRDDHADALVCLGFAMLDVVRQVSEESGVALGMRVGVHSGPVVAGVIGKTKFAYDLWGDTVNTAARMESHGEPGRVHVSADTAALLGGRFDCEARGCIAVKGKGEMETFFVADLRGERQGPQAA